MSAAGSGLGVGIIRATRAASGVSDVAEVAAGGLAGNPTQRAIKDICLRYSTGSPKFFIERSLVISALAKAAYDDVITEDDLKQIAKVYYTITCHHTSFLKPGLAKEFEKQGLSGEAEAIPLTAPIREVREALGQVKNNFSKPQLKKDPFRFKFWYELLGLMATTKVSSELVMLHWVRSVLELMSGDFKTYDQAHQVVPDTLRRGWESHSRYPSNCAESGSEFVTEADFQTYNQARRTLATFVARIPAPVAAPIDAELPVAPAVALLGQQEELKRNMARLVVEKQALIQEQTRMSAVIGTHQAFAHAVTNGQLTETLIHIRRTQNNLKKLLTHWVAFLDRLLTEAQATFDDRSGLLRSSRLAKQYYDIVFGKKGSLERGDSKLSLTGGASRRPSETSARSVSVAGGKRPPSGSGSSPESATAKSEISTNSIFEEGEHWVGSFLAGSSSSPSYSQTFLQENFEGSLVSHVLALVMRTKAEEKKSPPSSPTDDEVNAAKKVCLMLCLRSLVQNLSGLLKGFNEKQFNQLTFEEINQYYEGVASQLSQVVRLYQNMLTSLSGGDVDSSTLRKLFESSLSSEWFGSKEAAYSFSAFIASTDFKDFKDFKSATNTDPLSLLVEIFNRATLRLIANYEIIKNRGVLEGFFVPADVASAADGGAGRDRDPESGSSVSELRKAVPAMAALFSLPVTKSPHGGVPQTPSTVVGVKSAGHRASPPGLGIAAARSPLPLMQSGAGTGLVVGQGNSGATAAVDALLSSLI